MTYLPSASNAFAEFTEAMNPTRTPARVEAPAAKAPKRGFWRMCYDSVWNARQRQADIEIARYLAMTGGKLTDSAEREIARRMSGNGNFRSF